MVNLVSALLLSAVASAQVTTSIWLLKSFLGTDKLGFYGSVISVSGTTTTLAVVYDNGTDKSALGLASSPQTFTVGPNFFGAENTLPVARYSTSLADANLLRQSCTLAPTPSDASVSCNYSYGPAAARLVFCASGRQPNSTSTQFFTQTNTYSARLSYSAGVETITRALTVAPRTTPDASWCSDSTYLPPSGSAVPGFLNREDFAYYQLVVTAGLEKLNGTQGSSASRTSSGGSGTPAQNTAAAAPMKTMGPVLAGMGVAVAVFL